MRGNVCILLPECLSVEITPRPFFSLNLAQYTKENTGIQKIQSLCAIGGEYGVLVQSKTRV